MSIRTSKRNKKKQREREALKERERDGKKTKREKEKDISLPFSKISYLKLFLFFNLKHSLIFQYLTIFLIKNINGINRIQLVLNEKRFPNFRTSNFLFFRDFLYFDFSVYR